eukprot:gnl/TRDRNA2_/TRDRNA2_205077_c0_seq1.p1 gnl/TRDRNA2_/TRDRNA2_205077_c0~~gnl/TRDRNA2_/TRDRNA2_205077_c0_seq1.p1  ORF type:complete len:353 (-),score=63.44 gnl/TRDRNA2_/TRDRNA2_205077_c0_seq1:86-1144(-)
MLLHADSYADDAMRPAFSTPPLKPQDPPHFDYLASAATPSVLDSPWTTASVCDSPWLSFSPHHGACGTNVNNQLPSQQDLFALLSQAEFTLPEPPVPPLSTPPTTPRARSSCCDMTPGPLITQLVVPTTPPTRTRATSPPPAPKRAPEPPLMQAFASQSAANVRAVLEEDSEAALFPFFEHDVEPPLCCAVRMECDASIVSVLLEHGADVNAVDSLNRTPLAILCSKQCVGAHWSELQYVGEDAFVVGAPARAKMQQDTFNIAKMLIEAGADMTCKDKEGRALLDMAFRAGNDHLARLLVGSSASSLPIQGQHTMGAPWARTGLMNIGGNACGLGRVSAPPPVLPLRFAVTG